MQGLEKSRIMVKQVFIGVVVEGSTDARFLLSIIQRTFEAVAYQCTSEIEVIPPYLLRDIDRGNTFSDLVIDASCKGIQQLGALTVVVHTDSDTDSYEERFQHKFVPALERLSEFANDENYCTIITPLIPVRMIEAWMLADKKLLKDEIGTDLSDIELGIARDPEKIANPKAVISEAIRVATHGKSRRRQSLTISDLYGTIGASISLEELSRLASYRKFREWVEVTYRKLGYLSGGT